MRLSYSPSQTTLLGSLRCHYGDGDGNENVKKQLVKIRTTTLQRFFVHFFAVTARLRRDLPNFTFYRQREHTTTNLSYSLYTWIFFLRIQLWESLLT